MNHNRHAPLATIAETDSAVDENYHYDGDSDVNDVDDGYDAGYEGENGYASDTATLNGDLDQENNSAEEDNDVYFWLETKGYIHHWPVLEREELTSWDTLSKASYAVLKDIGLPTGPILQIMAHAREMCELNDIAIPATVNGTKGVEDGLSAEQALEVAEIVGDQIDKAIQIFGKEILQLRKDVKSATTMAASSSTSSANGVHHYHNRHHHQKKASPAMATTVPVAPSLSVPPAPPVPAASKGFSAQVAAAASQARRNTYAAAPIASSIKTGPALLSTSAAAAMSAANAASAATTAAKLANRRRTYASSLEAELQAELILQPEHEPSSVNETRRKFETAIHEHEQQKRRESATYRARSRAITSDIGYPPPNKLRKTTDTLTKPKPVGTGANNKAVKKPASTTASFRSHYAY
ncbi:hypothetical protein GQ42DRAFT_164716 [Ramicandelaber brevisporus]|nr:hypothetical protein GQ42DRAFT_164716 [Ramicandelaber brevisporus]